MYYRSSKNTTSSFRALDVRGLQRAGVLRVESGSVRLSYRHRRGESDSWHEENYPVPIDWTRCNYGGSRAWFRCPVAGCGRRVAILYGGEIFACRYCHKLNYESQHEQPYQRNLSRYQRIRVKLGGEPGCIYPFPQKPKGMHWRTYEYWRMKAYQAESCSWPNWVYRLVAHNPALR